MTQPAQPYAWALDLLGVAKAHAVTRGSRDIAVAVIDIGYRKHPAHEGHLWTNPNPTRGDLHGWDFAQDDASLEHDGPDSDTSVYLRGHHSFIVGEVAACAPECPIMVLRVGYGLGQHESWTRAIRYAAEHGARIIVMPHSYIQGQAEAESEALPGFAGHFYGGTDFAYPHDNPDLLAAMDEAWGAGALIFQGNCDNRGRYAALYSAAREPVFSVGTADRHGRPASITNRCAYVEALAPGGDRIAEDPESEILGHGGDENVIRFAGGCMAAGFAGGVAALALSRFPQLSNAELRQVLLNTTRPVEGPRDRIGAGLLDAAAIARLEKADLTPTVKLSGRAERVCTPEGPALTVEVEKQGVLAMDRALLVLFNGAPRTLPAPDTPRENPWKLATAQIGHAVAIPPGRPGHFHLVVPLQADPPETVWGQIAPLDAGLRAQCDTKRLDMRECTDD